MSQQYILGKRQAFQEMVLGKTGLLQERIKLGHFLITYTKINSKWIKYNNKTPGEKIGSVFFDMNLSSIFLDLPSQARATK